jgi:hypothetical protein
MKIMAIVWALCSVLSLGSFGVLLLQDRRLGVPLPYSIAIALTALVALAPALLVLYEKARGNRPIHIGTIAPRAPAPRATVRPRAAEGVVLLDFSTPASSREHAA